MRSLFCRSYLVIAPPLFLTSLLATPAWAGEKHDHEPRAHEAHVHGVAELTLVEDAGKVELELQAPGMSLAGFEHAPKVAADTAKISAVMSLLRDAGKVVSINGGNCKSISVDAKNSYPSLENADHEHENSHDHDDADTDEQGSTHHAFAASYQFQCAKTDTITGLQLPLLKTFPSLEEISVQWIIGGKQGARKITATETTLKF